VLRLIDDASGFSGGQSIVRAAEYEDLTTARDLLERATAEANRLREEAQQAFEQKQIEGHRNGFEDGARTMATRMLQWDHEIQSYLGQLEQQTIGIVLNAVRMVIGESSDQDVVRRIVAGLVEDFKKETGLVLRVSSGQFTETQRYLNERAAESTQNLDIKVVGDDKLEDTACILETQTGLVDASVETQIQAFEEAMNHALSKRDLDAPQQ
jgi:type III secretion protein L